MRARACIKCKEYVLIHPNSPLNQTKIYQFERRHHLHTLITVNLDEVKESYQMYKNNGSDNPSEELSNS
ncbi:MAG: hypothetical protein ACFFFB_20060 [Candidatus Heimdallarchaeota archaeon]